MKTSKKEIEKFQKWVESKHKETIVCNFAEVYFYEVKTKDIKEFELRAFETKSKHTEVYYF